MKKVVLSFVLPFALHAISALTASSGFCQEGYENQEKIPLIKRTKPVGAKVADDAVLLKTITKVFYNRFNLQRARYDYQIVEGKNGIEIALKSMEMHFMAQQAGFNIDVDYQRIPVGKSTLLVVTTTEKDKDTVNLVTKDIYVVHPEGSVQAIE